jgi:hypothetical protein
MAPEPNIQNLIARLHDPDSHIRGKAVAALREHTGAPEVQHALRSAIYDADDHALSLYERLHCIGQGRARRRGTALPKFGRLERQSLLASLEDQLVRTPLSESFRAHQQHERAPSNRPSFRKSVPRTVLTAMLRGLLASSDGFW